MEFHAVPRFQNAPGAGPLKHKARKSVILDMLPGFFGATAAFASIAEGMTAPFPELLVDR
jgi:hypothetical protein